MICPWLLTWTTYGTWLPGDKRGFVSGIQNSEEIRVIHNQPDTLYLEDMPSLENYSKNILKNEPVWLTLLDANSLLKQFHETAGIRNYNLRAVAILANHVHLVVNAVDKIKPNLFLKDFKSYGSRALNREGDLTKKSRRWWTSSGSARFLGSEKATQGAIDYVRNQKNPLLIWVQE